MFPTDSLQPRPLSGIQFLGIFCVISLGLAGVLPLNAESFPFAPRSLPPRFDTDLVKLPPSAPPTKWEVQDAFPGLTFNAPNTICSAPGDARKLFLIESAGRVWLIPDVTAPVPEKILFLDITDRVRTDGFERGAKGVACHPGFSTNGYIFVTYDVVDAGNRVRVSRFTRSSSNSLTADPHSEVVLINQIDDGPYHDVDTCRFAPDGYLYVAFGDEGGQNEEFQNAQRIDKRLYSCIIRIDVDKKPQNLEPNPDVEIPRDAKGQAFYSVPADNPFVGARFFNKQPVDPARVRTELYIVGLRNPWQFSFAPGTNKLWVADVQRDAREEIDLLGPGENGGWSWREGTIPGPRTGQLINGAAESDAVLVDPVLDYPHGTGPYEGASVTGGLLYQGSKYSSLNGLYIFADYMSGNIWTFDPAQPRATFSRLTGGQQIVAFLTDPTNGDILMVDRTGFIRRLIQSSDDSAFPSTLTATGFFSNLTNMTPTPGAIQYEPNVTFWSDYANKTRWFLVTDSSQTVTYSRDGKWSFPTGMIWAKHFDLELDRGNASTSKRIETRFLVKTDAGAYGVSYKWNDAGTEAFLVSEAGEEFDLSVTNHGTAGIQRYHIPSRAECQICHTAESGSALSFNTRQLNRDGSSMNGVSGNLLNLLSAAGYLVGLNEDPAVLPRYVRPDETQFALEERVRSYLAVNCAYCHHSGGSAPSAWDASPQLNLWDTGLVNGLPLAAGSDPSHRLVFPGSPEKSVLWNRIAATNGYSRMPPLASRELDTDAIQLLHDWIVNVVPNRQSYDDWRLLNFGDLTSSQGNAAEDPDGDGWTNQAEFLFKSDPRNALDIYRPQLVLSNGSVTMMLPNLTDRRVIIETTFDLGRSDSWVPWIAPGNNGLVPAAGAAWGLTGPLLRTQFFRIRMSEE